jgi:hypothetical protein
MLPAGQAAVTDGSVDQPEGKEPGEGAFSAGLCVAAGLIWFGAGLGLAAFWVPPTAWP